MDIPIGELAVIKEPKTLQISGLGSCIAISLYDTRHRIGGLAHAVLSLPPHLYDRCGGLPSSSVSSSSIDARYIEVAIDEMLIRMYALGSKKEDIAAKIIGGANLFVDVETDFTSNNIVNTRKKLKDEGIKIAGESVGGNLGRSVEFDVSTGIVTVKIKF